MAKTCTSDFTCTSGALCQIKSAPENYMNDFKNACVIFNQQTIFEMTTYKTISLYDCFDKVTPTVQRLCGEYFFMAHIADLIFTGLSLPCDMLTMKTSHRKESWKLKKLFTGWARVRPKRS